MSFNVSTAGTGHEIPFSPTRARFHLTLDDALAEVAGRSFYEDVKVTPAVMVDDPADIVGYVTEDDHGHGLTEEWEWTYADGIRDRDSVSETSRLHDAAEFYDEARHIRYNLPDSVDALERGVPVTFGYAVATVADLDYDEDGNALDEDGELTDDVAGWLLASIVWED